jgi:hypothetical protein
MAPSMARTRGGSESATLSSRLNRPLSASRASTRRMVSCGDNSLVTPLPRRKSSSATSGSGSAAHAYGRRVWTVIPLPMSSRGRLSEFVETSPLPWGRTTPPFGRRPSSTLWACPAWYTWMCFVLSAGRSSRACSRHWPALRKGNEPISRSSSIQRHWSSDVFA